MNRMLRLLLALILMVATAAAQFSINGTELVSSAPAVNNPNKNVGTNPDASIGCANGFGVDLVVEWRLAGVTVGSTTIQRESTLSFGHGMGVGTYEIWVRDAGKPPAAAVKCGNLVVV